MTRDELVTTLQELRDDVAPVDTDAAAELAVLARMLRAGSSLGGLTEAALEAQLQEINRQARRS